MNLASKVKQRRIELGLSQEELAKKMGYSSRTSINKIENGRPVSQKIIVRLAEALETTPAYLMGWEDNLEKKAEEFKPYTIETLKKIISSNPELAYKSLATVCMNKRVQLDWTEKKVANLANVD